MRYCNARRIWQQVSFLRKQFVQGGGLPFSEVLSAEMVQRVLGEYAIAFIDRIYTPVLTLWVFLSQVISDDGSCRAAVARLLAHRAARSQGRCSARTGAYCQARGRLPEKALADLVRHTGHQLERQAQPAWLWKGRHVKIFDGSTVSMPDTPDNQQAYPQHGQQKHGVGFPLARIAAVFSLACGAVLDLAICRYQGKGQSELGLFRCLWDVFAAGDVMLSDRYLCSWCEMALLRQRGVDVVCRLHQRRTADFRRGKRLGKDDHLVQWKKPRRPDWMDQATYARLPERMWLREVRVRVEIPGFRSEQLVVVTTLLDAKTFSPEDLAELYRARWHAELDLRVLKETMHMDVLRTKTPSMVRKEIWTHLLAYNLIRTVMAQAAVQHGLLPRSLSFKGAKQTFEAFHPILQLAAASQLPPLYDTLLDALATHRVGDRPDRSEPRARKRRPKPYPLLTQPRNVARNALQRNS